MTPPMVTIYVLPTEEGYPPRAILGQAESEDEVPDVGDTMFGDVAVWTGDLGCWTMHGTPLPKDLSDTISDHARSLGVPGF